MFLLYIKFLSFYFYGILSTLHVIFSKKCYLLSYYLIFDKRTFQNGIGTNNNLESILHMTI